MDYPIGVFDSGVGGLNVLKKCMELLPQESFIYLADKANMPYGNKTKRQIADAAFKCTDVLFSLGCKAVVIACNTATATAVDDVRAMYSTRVVVGLEPAVKPCVKELGKNGYAVALVTDATYRSDKFNRLLDSCDKKVVALARPELAKLIEDNTDDINRIEPHMRQILSKYMTAESVILGCSHYTYLTDIISRIYGRNIKIYDGAEGAAKRLKYCLEIAGLTAKNGGPTTVKFISTYKV